MNPQIDITVQDDRCAILHSEIEVAGQPMILQIIIILCKPDI
jgi:hypothetical protein